MDLAIFSMNGIYFLLRWAHFIFGIIWIGLLYYFNYVQVPFFAETDAATKSNAIQKLVPRALWWFRWAAMFTFITGWVIITGKYHELGDALFSSSYGVCILTGAAFASLMWFNVWFVIWPNQKIVIQSTTQSATGGQALPNAAAAGAKALLASRTNTLLSFPMLFFMGAASHLPIFISNDNGPCNYALAITIILGAIEYNVFKGKIGPLATIKGVIHYGMGLAVLAYLLLEFLVK